MDVARSAKGLTVLLAAAMLLLGVQSISSAAGSYKVTEGPYGIVRWNPCQTVTYKYNVSALDKSLRKKAAKYTKKAFKQLGSATGISFVNEGATQTLPDGANWWRVQSVEEEIVVAWVKKSGKYSSDLISGGAYGVGGMVYKTWESDGGHSVAGRGYVLVDTKSYTKLTNGFKSGASQGNLLLHELGHTMGLEHVSSKKELMYDTLTSKSPKGYASGDRAGLAMLGRDGGCIDVPDWVWVEG